MDHPLKLNWTGRIKVGGPNGNHYYAVKCPEHPNAWKNGYIYEHRIVLECKIGRLLTSNEIAHHKNGVKSDNDPDNLEVKINTVHNSEHSTTGRTMVLLRCKECEKDFEREIRNVTAHPARFCSRSCNGRYQRRKQLADVA